jgi:hypothetical protein
LESPEEHPSHFAANLKGAVPAIQGYAGDVAAQRKEDLARLAAERGEKGKVFEGVMGSREKAEQRKSAEEIARAAARICREDRGDTSIQSLKYEAICYGRRLPQKRLLRVAH